jgi:hypothetical protein
MSWLWNKTNLDWVGYYLAPAPDRVNASWMGQLSALKGWQVAPIYIGTQQTFTSPPPSAAVGVTDGQQAISELIGFPTGTTVYLDIEQGGLQSQPELSYIASWCSKVAAANYNPAIYCPRSAYASISSALVSAGEPDVSYWIANQIYDPDTNVSPFPDPNPSGSGVTTASAWQYWGTVADSTYAISTPYGSVTADLNSVRVSATTPPPPPMPPVLSGGGNSVNYTPQGVAVAVDAGLGVSDASNATLAGATVAISAGLLAGDTLNFTNQKALPEVTMRAQAC